MEYLTAFVVGTVISWVSLLVVIPIAQKLADFSMPPWSQALWKLAVVAAAGNVVAVALDPVNFWLSAGVGGAVFWLIMWWWFDMDFFGALIAAGVSMILRSVVGAIMLALIGSVM